MELKDVKKVGVIGCGAIGPTIAAAVAIKYPVIVKEVSDEQCARGFKSILGCLPALVKKGVITEVEQEIATSRIAMTTKMDDFKDCQVIIDAVPDILETKQANFAELNKICPPETVFTTTSSLLSVTSIAAGCGRPEKFVGTHFNYPAHIMALVEVAPAMQTDKKVVDFILEFLKSGLEKSPISTKDSPGFIVNFIFMPFLIRAIEALENNLGTVEDIDNAIKLGLAHRVGPFELMDMFGLDSNVRAFTVLYEQFRDARYAPPRLLVKVVEAGFLGKKTGKGWYIYDGNGKKVKGNDQIKL
jgi:3-hydroxybutyryl-CoA dehydrogenase